MAKRDLFEFEGDDRAIGWLADMQPASAAALKPDFLYRAGYEAARAELLSKLRRRLAVASAALVLAVVGAGSLVYELGSRHGQVLAARHVHADDGGPTHEQHPAVVRKNIEDSATNQAPATEASEATTPDEPADSGVSKVDQSLAASAREETPAISRWWQSQLREYFVGSAPHRDRDLRRSAGGRAGADGDDLLESVLDARQAVSLVTKSHAGKSRGAKPTAKETPTDSPTTPLPGSLLPLRDRQIQRLMDETL